jgi:hypothetical protein
VEEITLAPEELRAVLHRSPFVPFKLTVTEGSAYDVRHPELCMVGRRSAVLGLIGADAADVLFERTVTVDLLHIVKLEPLESAARKKNNGAA